MEKKSSTGRNAKVLLSTSDLDKWTENMSDFTLGISSEQIFFKFSETTYYCNS